jgi:DNA polymerase III epsilon subunit family exonuclease
MAINSPVSYDEVIVLDVETTGLDYKTEQIIELAAVRLRVNPEGNIATDADILESFSTLIRPTVPIRHSSQAIHGISAQQLANEPLIESVLPDFLDFVGDLPYVAHGAVTDYTFINQACRIHLGKPFTNVKIDTHDLYKSVFPEEPSHGLASMLERFGQPKAENAHRALDDSMVLAKVYPKLQALFNQKHAWQLSQMQNVPYLLERYLRLQKSMQTIGAELADLKDVFKLYFRQGGGAIQASNGEWMTAQTKRSYDFDEAAVWTILTDAGILDKPFKFGPKALEKIIYNRKSDPDLVKKLRNARKPPKETVHISFLKPHEYVPSTTQ